MRCKRPLVIEYHRVAASMIIIINNIRGAEKKAQQMDFAKITHTHIQTHTHTYTHTHTHGLTH